MQSERIQQRIERLLAEADEAVAASDWARVMDRANNVLAFDPKNADALAYVAAADRARGGRPPTSEPAAVGSTLTRLPSAFSNGRYEVKRFLGEGGKKKVYLAHDTLLDRDVAFAMIKTDGLDEIGKQRITREAQAMGRLGAHPHIVSVFDLGNEVSDSGDDAQPFIVTELMVGGDLEGMIEAAPDRRVPIAEAIRISDQIARALEHAHQQGVVHRDLKPGNVWLTADGIAKLGDFGLAVALDRSRLTQAGMMVGTVAYMPPEQAIGGEVTARSDLYSLGAMLYELVTGRPPFIGDESVAVITQHLNTPPVVPTWHRPDCPPGLEALILRLLEKDPMKRPAKASEVREALVAVGVAPTVVAPYERPAEESPLYLRTFVGREPELSQLQRAFDAALSGQGGLAMVVGEPGIGKTALCEQISTYVTVRGGRTLVGHCYEEGSLSIPYLAFVEAMRTYVLAREPEGLKQDLGSGAAEVARIVSEIRDRVDIELRPPGDPDDDRWRLLQAVAGFLRTASTVQPLLLVLEDLHWADRGTLDLLLHVARNLGGARLLVVGNYRDVEVDRSHPLASAVADLRRIGTFQRIPLRGLTVDEVHRMITNVRGQEPPWSRAEAIHRQTEGNPLFVQEVLRYLVEEGLVVREGGRYARTDGTDPEAGIPEGLRDVIGKRLSRLSPECNRLLSVAAVIGRDFAMQTLQAVGGASEDSVVGALEEASRVGILEQHGRPGDLRFRFSHALFRQTLYEEIFAPRRIRLHQQVARTLEAQYASRIDDHAAELAEHFAQGTDPNDLAKSVRFAEIAAQRALSVYAHSEAVRHLEQALQAQDVLDPGDRARRCDLLLALSEALMPAGEARRAFEEIAAEAFALAEALDDSERASRACGIAIEAQHRANPIGAGIAFGTPTYRLWAERADRWAEPASHARVMADIALGSIEDSAWRWREERLFTGRALDLARDLNDSQALFEAGQRMMRANWPPASWSEQLTLARELTAHARDGLRTRPLGLVLLRAAAVFLAAGERDRSEVLWSDVEHLARRTGDVEALVWAIEVETVRATLDGRLAEAVDAGARAMARADELGRESYPPSPIVLHYLGRAAEVLDFSAASAPWSRAVSLARAGRLDDARATINQILGAGQPLAQEGAPAVALGYLLEASILVGDKDRAGALAGRLGDLTAANTGGNWVFDIGRHLGAAAALLGQTKRAREHYLRTLDWATSIQYRPEIALTRLQLAELLLDQFPVERADAIGHLDFAIQEFRAMNMQPSLERALSHRGLLRA